MEVSVIASGSNGNCCFIEEKETSLLIDAGKSCRETEKRLNTFGKSLENVDALLLTHSHIDHVSGAGAISRRYNIPVYATKEIQREAGHLIGNVAFKLYKRDQNFFINDLIVHPIETSHDVPCCGFVINHFGIFTDTGIVTKPIEKAIHCLKGVVLESNHDIDMLISGPYPQYLKERILGNYGHLSNIHASQLIEEKGTLLSFALLGHLSKTNNTVKIARDTFETIVKRKIECEVCSRDKETGIWEL